MNAKRRTFCKLSFFVAVFGTSAADALLDWLAADRSR